MSMQLIDPGSMKSEGTVTHPGECHGCDMAHSERGQKAVR